MNSNRILKISQYFYLLATNGESEAKNLKSILKSLEELDTYNARKEYADKHLKHLSSGSSRIVYLTDQDTVIKLAKNDKGLAQNKAEANVKMKSKFINKVLKHGPEYMWIEVAHLKKMTVKNFKKMTGLEFEDFGDALSYGLRQVSENKDKDKPDNYDQVAKTEIYKELERLGKRFKLMPGDLSRISSWGVKDNNPVLLDAGLTKDVYSKYYD